ncbi:hypothetical protein [Bdellovibrio sp. HCB274]|uniref:hypothetical protein n=1 Tax=Bdellovibrio sp. HCB274 TaxID=3394361 RepID=UPI0039B50E5F
MFNLAQKLVLGFLLVFGSVNAMAGSAFCDINVIRHEDDFIEISGFGESSPEAGSEVALVWMVIPGSAYPLKEGMDIKAIGPKNEEDIHLTYNSGKLVVEYRDDLELESIKAVITTTPYLRKISRFEMLTLDYSTKEVVDQDVCIKK